MMAVRPQHTIVKASPEPLVRPGEEGEDWVNVCKLNTYQFCPRRVYLECVQAEFNSNHHTEEGNDLHAVIDERDRAYFASSKLKLCGYIDTMDPKEQVPVEYKKGHPTTMYNGQPMAWPNEAVQLCAQGILLEEALEQTIEYGYIFYGETRRRVRVDFDEALRTNTLNTLDACREVLLAPQAPAPLVNSPKCDGCSLIETCMPDELNRLKHPLAEESNEKNSLETALLPARPQKSRCLVPVEDGAILALSQPGSALKKSGDSLVVTLPGGEKQTIGIHRVRQIWINQPTSLTSSALDLCLKQNVGVLFHSFSGKYLGQLMGPFNKHVQLRRIQFKTFEDSQACLSLAQTLVSAKLRNQRVFLQRNLTERNDDSMHRIRVQEKTCLETTSLDSLLGIEGSAASLYFGQFDGLLKVPEIAFEKRLRRPAPDPVNALLGFGYALLTGECVSALHKAGFDPYFGFYHQSRYGRPALALDLMEPLRPVIVDSLVVTLFNKKQLTLKDFTWEGQRCILTDDGRRTFFKAWSQRLETECTHPLFGYALPYRRLIALEARILAAYLLGDIPRYQPFTWR